MKNPVNGGLVNREYRKYRIYLIYEHHPVLLQILIKLPLQNYAVTASLGRIHFSNTILFTDL